MSDAESVTVMEDNAFMEANGKGVTSGSQNGSDGLSRRFGCLPIGHMGCTTMQEIIGLPTVESLSRIRLKAPAEDRIAIGFLRTETIDLLAIVGGYIGDVGFVFESAFNLKGRNAGIDEFG